MRIEGAWRGLVMLGNLIVDSEENRLGFGREFGAP